MLGNGGGFGGGGRQSLKFDTKVQGDSLEDQANGLFLTSLDSVGLSGVWGCGSGFVFAMVGLPEVSKVGSGLNFEGPVRIVGLVGEGGDV